jgi:hypothetical protein
MRRHRSTKHHTSPRPPLSLPLRLGSVVLSPSITITSCLNSCLPVPVVFITSVLLARQNCHHSPHRFLTSRFRAASPIVPNAMRQPIRSGTIWYYLWEARLLVFVRSSCTSYVLLLLGLCLLYSLGLSVSNACGHYALRVIPFYSSRVLR